MNLRREKNLKAKVIDEEIKALLKFLPNAKLEHLNHKLSSITLTFPNGETHQVKYEVAHTNIGIYQGDRKDRALDALLVCYLYGWNEGKIKYFMDKHGKKNFWNVPDFLVSVLWERGKV